MLPTSSKPRRRATERQGTERGIRRMVNPGPAETGPEPPEALGRPPRPQTDGSGRPNLAMRLRSMRAAHNWTLEEASHHTGVSRSTLSKIENDWNRNDKELDDIIDDVLPAFGGREFVSVPGRGNGAYNPRVRRVH